MTTDKLEEQTSEKNEEATKEVEKKSEEETSEKTNEEETKDESSEGEEKTSEKNPYEAKLKELEENEGKLIKEKEDLEYNKKKAISEERDKRKKLEERIKELEEKDNEDKPEGEKKYLTQEEVDKIISDKLSNERSLSEVDGKASDEAERKLIRKYIDMGYSANDAYLKANAHIIDEHKGSEKRREQEEDILTGISAGQQRGEGGQPAYNSEPVLKEAAKDLTPEERKYLK